MRSSLAMISAIDMIDRHSTPALSSAYLFLQPGVDSMVGLSNHPADLRSSAHSTYGVPRTVLQPRPASASQPRRGFLLAAGHWLGPLLSRNLGRLAHHHLLPLGERGAAAIVSLPDLDDRWEA